MKNTDSSKGEGRTGALAGGPCGLRNYCSASSAVRLAAALSAAAAPRGGVVATKFANHLPIRLAGTKKFRPGAGIGEFSNSLGKKTQRAGTRWFRFGTRVLLLRSWQAGLDFRAAALACNPFDPGRRLWEVQARRFAAPSRRMRTDRGPSLPALGPSRPPVLRNQECVTRLGKYQGLGAMPGAVCSELN